MPRQYDNATLQALAGRQDTVARSLVWIRARRFDSDVVEAAGFWNGDQRVSVVIDGEARTYEAAGSLLGVPDLTATSGVRPRIHEVTLSPINEAVLAAMRSYETRLAPIQIHRALYSTEDMALLSAPHRVFKGWVNQASETTGSEGGESSVTLRVSSAALALTRTLATKKSDESQRRRGDDRFRRHGDVAGVVNVKWEP